MSTGRNPSVKRASGMLTTLLETITRINASHKYAKTENTTVMRNAENSLILRTSVEGIAMIHAAIITNKLKAAEPTIVDDPRSPASISSLKSSITDKQISGAEEPKAMSDKVATVSFQIFTVIRRPDLTCTLRFQLVMASIEAMNLSDIMAIPKKK